MLNGYLRGLKLIFIITIIFSFVFLGLKLKEKEVINSYDYFFSSERIFEDLSLECTENYNFAIDENGKLFKYSDNLSPLNKFDPIIIIFDEGFVTEYFIVCDEIFFVVDNKIYKSDLNGNKVEIVVSVPEKISNIFATSELVWFKSEDSIFRLHYPSGTLEKIYTNENIVYYRPITNYSFRYDIYSEKWIEYLESGGNPHEQVLFAMTKTYIYNSNTGENYEASFKENYPNEIIYNMK